MQRLVRCWWCGYPATVDTELPADAGMVRDTDTSWLCEDNVACSQRVTDRVKRTGLRIEPR